MDLAYKSEVSMSNLRMFLAEVLLRFIVKICPQNEEGALLRKYIFSYFFTVMQEFYYDYDS